ncbi:MAG TPA: hypothetical protein VIB47_02645 [Dehalococcoidia bacterium]|jgi:hypothetical protein
MATKKKAEATKFSELTAPVEGLNTGDVINIPTEESASAPQQEDTSVLVSTVSVYFKCMRPLPKDEEDPQPGVCAGEVQVQGALDSEYDAACAKCSAPYHMSITHG